MPRRAPILLLLMAAAGARAYAPPGWAALKSRATETPTGARLADERAQRALGRGPPHTDALLRLFDAPDEDAVRVTLYRDDAAWCPYCQKVWLLLEEKRIPYRVKKINMRSYGPKPAWFTRMVPGGLLPAIELDGELMTDSLPIMQVLDSAFGHLDPPMLPPSGSDDFAKANALLNLERQLFRDWCTLTFRPGKGIFDAHEKALLKTMGQVDAALRSTAGPWFLGGDAPSLVDLQYISHIERMLASLLYWKGVRAPEPRTPHNRRARRHAVAPCAQLRIRGTRDFPGLNTWLEAFEARPAYLATKSDYYTHVRDIPPQYGEGYFAGGAEEFTNAIGGERGAWRLPLELGRPGAVEPIAPGQLGESEEVFAEIFPTRAPPRFGSPPCRRATALSRAQASRHEAAFELASNGRAVARFAARGAGSAGVPGYQAPLADPNAEPAEDMVDPADAVLRHVVGALLEGEAGLIGAEKALREELSAMPQRGEGSRRQLQVRTHASPSPRHTHAVVRWHM